MVAEGNVGIAFALVFAAGLSTTLGASCAFFARLAEPIYLAAGLGISAGVMLYVSFVEIFMQKGVVELQAIWGDDEGYRYGTMFFFGGMVITAILDRIVHLITNLIPNSDAPVCAAGSNVHTGNTGVAKSERSVTEEADKGVKLDGASVDQPKMTGESSVSTFDMEAGGVTQADNNCLKLERKGPEAQPVGAKTTFCEDEPIHLTNVPADMTPEAADLVDTYMSNDHHRYALKKMGVLTAVAIGVHNLPEGLATFVAALSDPLNGVAIAVAIALHNIPEGVCVAMPVYYATGSRWKGFWWAFLSGLSEPLGGLLGWLVLAGNTGHLTYGLLFTFVGGMMTYISIKELIPTALKYDPNDRVTSTCVIAGMVVMAASLLCFTI